MGLALGAALLEARAAETVTYMGRAPEPPPHPIFDGAAGYRAGIEAPPQSTTAVILAVPDRALAEVAQELADAGSAPARGAAALHMAGALSTAVLEPLHSRGYAVGSLHPMQTVADPWCNADRLMGCAYAVAGEPEALAAARRLVNSLGGQALLVPPASRPVYHAAAVAGSNYLVVLCAFAARLLQEAGIDEEDAVAALIPMLRSTISNVEQLGLTAALTGPIARGDVDTVRLHLSQMPEADRVLYRALGSEALRLAREAGLEQARWEELRKLLSIE